MQVNVQQCIQKLSQTLPSILMLFGDEPQQKIDVIDTLRKEAQKQGFDERHQFTAGPDFEWYQLSETANAMSLFSSKQYIELELPTGKPGTQGAKALMEFAEQSNDEVILLLHGPQLGQDVKKSKWCKVLSEKAWFCPTYELKDRQLTAWIMAYANQLALNLGPNEALMIADMSEGNLLATKQELDKLSLSFAGKTIDEKTILDALVDQSRFSVYQLNDELLTGNLQKAVKILQRLESEGIEPNIVLWNLINESQKLMECKQQQNSKGSINFNQLRIWQSKQPLYKQALARLSLSDLETQQRHLHQADIMLKSQTPAKPFVILAHLMLLFLPSKLAAFELL